MDDDGDLTLNLFTPDIKKNVAKSLENITWSNRHERIKARKLLKLTAQTKPTQTATLSEPQTNTYTEKSEIVNNKKRKITDVSLDFDKNKRRNDGSDNVSSAPTKKLKDGLHFSSLFNSNPEIPTINVKPVECIKEEVFSSDSFESLSLDTYMLRNLRETMKFNKMTHVQEQAIPSILNGSDALVKSQTGSGKTLAYAIPIIHALQSVRPKICRGDGVFAIVILPTRELALQSYEVFRALVKPYQWIVPGCTIGGEKRKAEKARVRKGINVLLGTPGRLADHVIHTKSLHLFKLRYLIIDEADRLFEMGFEKDVKLIIDCIQEKTLRKQTVLLSATLTDGVERLAGMSLDSPVRIDASQDETTCAVTPKSDQQINTITRHDNTDECPAFSVPEKLKQLFLVTPCKLRLVSLIALIADKCVVSFKKSKMIVFLSTQDSVEFLHKLFSNLFINENEPVSSVNTLLSDQQPDTPKSKCLVTFYKLHGNMDQKDRTLTFTKFSTCQSGILICTDVAARGLHLNNIQWIVQYTTPADAKEYIHRVGRTARAGAQGNSLLFLMPSETEYVKTLSNMKINMKEITMRNVLHNLLLLFEKLPKILEHDRRPPRTYEEAATTLQIYIEKVVNDEPEMQEVAKKAFQSFVRGYSTYPKHLKSIFHIKYLHLGHLAKSFGLRDAPGGFSGGKNTVQFKKKNFHKQHPRLEIHNPKEYVKKPLSSLYEFSSGY